MSAFKRASSILCIYIIVNAFICCTQEAADNETDTELEKFLEEAAKVHGSIAELTQNTSILFLEQYDAKSSKLLFRTTELQWNSASNITDYNKNLSDLATTELDLWNQKQANIARNFDPETITDESVRRQLESISHVSNKLDAMYTEKLNSLVSSMESIYSTAKICNYANQSCDLNNANQTGNCSTSEVWVFDPCLEGIMSSSRDPELLAYVWKKWRDVTGRVMVDKYREFVKLSNKGAKAAGFADTGGEWRRRYEVQNFEGEVEKLWMEVLPLYEELHTYVRRKLRSIYETVPQTEGNTIPTHLLGNMWAQTWEHIYKETAPYPGLPTLDITEELRKQSFTPKRMFDVAESFFVSLGLPKMRDEFWNRSIIERPTDREIVCHASAWDFYSGKDFAIKMCTKVNMEDLITIHHEMGHVEYFMGYAQQPVAFRDGANPGFHEAIGDTIALSVSTPTHLKKLGLLPDYQPSAEQTLNYLYKMALEKVAFLPFGYLIDKYRWKVFDGTVPLDSLNSYWWDLRRQFQGITPPVSRKREDFDAGSKYHIPANVPYIRYFISFVIQFQFHKALCDAAGWSGPLHECDIDGNRTAGERLWEMLQMGSSKPWPDALMAIANTTTLSAKPLLNYFEPLRNYLRKANADAKDCYGWNAQWPLFYELPSPRCKDSNSEDMLIEATATEEQSNAEQWLSEYSAATELEQYEYSETSWNYNTNITEDNAKALAAATVKLANFENRATQAASRFNKSAIPDKQIKRLLEKVARVGIKLNANDTLRRNTTVLCTYSTRHDTNCSRSMRLEPEITRALSNSQNYDELLYLWTKWHNDVGRPIKPLYREFVELSNKGASAEGYHDMGEYWRSSYEDENFVQTIETLWNELLPLYEHLHTYVRRRLRQVHYGMFQTSTIPAHILGNMWAQDWSNLFRLTAPFPYETAVDVTDAMVENEFNATRMFRMSEEFFVSLGLKPMPETFWQKSMIVQPENRKVVCHGSAWDFSNGKDFRIKMCTDVTMDDLITIHHEMGHVQYYLQYADLPIAFRRGANPGFHEAVGDTLALAVSTPKHLEAIGLLNSVQSSFEADINYLYDQALRKLAFLPFGYLIDRWRWAVFDGTSDYDQWNRDWWHLRTKYQGIVEPVPRSEHEFDPGAKYHVPNNTPYIRYFVSHVIQYQFYEAMCKAAGHTGPLYKCDFYKSKAAGRKLAAMLRMGSSRPWPEAMMAISGQLTMSSQAIKAYFEPLLLWLQNENKKTSECFGWSAAWNADVLNTLPEPRCSDLLPEISRVELHGKFTDTLPNPDSSKDRKRYYEAKLWRIFGGLFDVSVTVTDVRQSATHARRSTQDEENEVDFSVQIFSDALGNLPSQDQLEMRFSSAADQIGWKQVSLQWSSVNNLERETAEKSSSTTAVVPIIFACVFAATTLLLLVVIWRIKKRQKTGTESYTLKDLPS